MTLTQEIITIALLSLATIITRYLPFMVFSSQKPTPPFVRYLGDALPCAIFAMLVVYCLKNVSLFSGSHGLPEGIAILATVIVHQWKNNTLLSIAAGTVCYMILVQIVF